ncbi:MAG: cyclic nucleotide-binding domain-containing protein [Panacagrimonas sp.]
MNSSARVTPELFDHFVPLNSLRPEAKRGLARNSNILNLAEGQTLFQAGGREERAFFLLDGDLALHDEAGTVVSQVRGGSPEAAHRVGYPSPHRFEARCVNAVRSLAVDSQLLDVMLTWDQTDAVEVGELSRDSQVDAEDWMTRLLQTPAFQMVPPSNLQAIFMRMQQVDAKAGEVIVRQDESGDYFYVITQGRCLVTREQPHQRPIRLAELETGSCFGEEALISDAPRNATVSMITGGSLMRLAKADFHTLLKEPLTRHLSLAEAEALVEGGRATFLDVRLPSEFANGHLKGSQNLPLYLLRLRLPQLPKTSTYICICDTGRRSSVAAFVLIQKGYEACTLAHGLEAGR